MALLRESGVADAGIMAGYWRRSMPLLAMEDPVNPPGHDDIIKISNGFGSLPEIALEYRTFRFDLVVGRKRCNGRG